MDMLTEWYIIPLLLPLVAIVVISRSEIRHIREKERQDQQDRLQREKFNDIIEMAKDQTQTEIELGRRSIRTETTTKVYNEHY